MKIEIIKENEMQHAIYINNEPYIRCGAFCTAEKIVKEIEGGEDGRDNNY